MGTYSGENFVDLTSGDDAGAGTSGDPYLTIGKAFDERTGAGGWHCNVTGALDISTALDITNGVAPTSVAYTRLMQWAGQPRPQITLSDCKLLTAPFSGMFIQGFDFIANNTGSLKMLELEDYCCVTDCNFEGDDFSQAIDFDTFGFNYANTFSNFDSPYGYICQGLGSNGQMVGCKFLNCNSNTALAIGVNTWGFFNNYMELVGASGGIKISGHNTKAYGNVVVSRDGLAIYGIGDSTGHNCINAQNNYVEGCVANYDFYDDFEGIFRRNVSFAPATAGRDFYRFPGGADATNIVADRSWLRGDWIDERLRYPHMTKDPMRNERSAMLHGGVIV